MQQQETTIRRSGRLKTKTHSLNLLHGEQLHQQLRQQQNNTGKMVNEKSMDLEGWSILEQRVDELHKFLEGQIKKIHLFTPEEYIEVYTTIYNLCVQQSNSYSELLYGRYKETFDEYIYSTVLPSLSEKHSLLLLKELVRRWSDHKAKVRWLSHWFTYLDRYYLPRTKSPSLRQTGIICFREKVYEETKGRVKDVMIILINQDREGERIDRALIKNVASIFAELSNEHHEEKLDLYTKDLELPLICSTGDYYAQKAARHIDVDSCPQYLLMAEKCLIREKEITASCLQRDSEEKLLKIAQQELLTVHSIKLLEKENTGLHVLIQNNEAEHLSRLYRLFSKIDDGLTPVAAAFQKHVSEEGLALVKSAADVASQKNDGSKETVSIDQIFARGLIELHDRFMGYVNGYFGSHLLFHNAIREAFLIFCNKDVAGTSSPELLSAFVDNVLRKGGGSEKLSDEAIEETLDKIVVMLNYLLDKDLFAEFCRKKLCRRLMFDRSVDIEHERSLLSKLKQNWGGQLTSKMEGMITDLTLAKESQQAFRHYLEACPQENPGIDISFTVLTTGFWPNYKASDPHLPREMAIAAESFKQFYRITTKHRKLNVIYSLGTCILTGRFKPKTMEINASTYQAATLSLFNESEKLSYQEIVSQLNLADEDVLRLLHSLSCARYKILKKEPNSKTVSKSDIFEFNEMFTDKLRRIKISVPPMDERKKVMDDVDKDRRYTIDAAIVRIMKSRKVLNYQQLSSECVQQLSHLFKPDFRLIKKRVEELIQRDYLERDRDNPSMLKYIA